MMKQVKQYFLTTFILIALFSTTFAQLEGLGGLGSLGGLGEGLGGYGAYGAGPLGHLSGLGGGGLGGLPGLGGLGTYGFPNLLGGGHGYGLGNGLGYGLGEFIFSSPFLSCFLFLLPSSFFPLFLLFDFLIQLSKLNKIF